MTHPASQVSGKWLFAGKQAIVISAKVIANHNDLMLRHLIYIYLCEIKEPVFYFILWQLFTNLMKMRQQREIMERHKIAGGHTAVLFMKEKENTGSRTGERDIKI